jgi:MFS family permease
MKIDLVGEKNRGLAMGLNEFAGYISVALVGFATGWVAIHYGLRPYPFYIGIGLALSGLFLSLFFVRDTLTHCNKEASNSTISRLRNNFKDTSWKHPNLGAVTQAGLVNNLNDGMAWGLLPILLATKGFDLKEIGLITAIYPGVWGLGQLFTGKMADHYSKKLMLFCGMFLQGFALLTLVLADSFIHFAALLAVLGLGTALVYPTFLATIAENTHPEDRPKSVGTFRLWRDLGYAIGAVLTGVLADLFNINMAIIFIGSLTLLSALIILIRMSDQKVGIYKATAQTFI